MVDFLLHTVANPRRVIWRLVLTGVVVCLLNGCDLFSTRDAEDPVTGRSTWSVPLEPQDVMLNITRAFVDLNSVDYMLSISSDSFSFIPDAVALSNHPELEGWSLMQESYHITHLFEGDILSQDTVLSVQFEDIVLIESPGPDSEYWQAKYTISGVTVPGVARQLSGTAEFHLVVESEGYWVIRRWEDRRTEGEETWSDLKARVR